MIKADTVIASAFYYSPFIHLPIENGHDKKQTIIECVFRVQPYDHYLICHHMYVCVSTKESPEGNICATRLLLLHSHKRYTFTTLKKGETKEKNEEWIKGQKIGVH